MSKFISYIAFLSFLFSCSDQVADQSVFTKMDQTGIEFNNKISNSRDFNIFSYRNFYNGAGVATGDINNDGLADVFFTANMGSNKLFLNKGNFTFEDISEKAGFHDKKEWSTGVVMVDINHDNLLDIYVCNAGFQKGVGNTNELWINNGNLSFTEKAKEYGLNESGYTTHAAFFDYDLDGDLDAYILKNSFIPVNTLNYSNKRDLRAEDWPVADFLKGGGDKLLRNDNGKFIDVSKEANIYGSLIGFGLGVTVGDVNQDGYPDIYVSNDFFERDYLYINQKNGSFKEELENRIQHLSHSSMGADMADINNDGLEDIFVTEMLPDNDYRLKTTTSFENIDVQRYKEKSGFYHQFMQNTLQLNNGKGNFQEIAQYAGVAASDWSWGALMFDADNDGWNDIYICNGIYNDVTDQDFIDFFANESWAITYSFEEDGYVKDDDAKDINYTELLDQMKTDTKEANEKRVKDGYEKIQLVGWAQEPFYDNATHKLHWAKEIKFETDSINTLNYNIRMLGRRGVLVMNVISGMDNLPLVKSKMNTILASTDFTKENRYEDFNSSTDKIAEYGIGTRQYCIHL